SPAAVCQRGRSEHPGRSAGQDGFAGVNRKSDSSRLQFEPGSPQIGESPGHLMPARRKLWMNWRWNSRKPSRSGAEVISVAAQMIDQSMPWSVDANTCNPTVSGRASTELVTISGHRKLFQW